MTETEESKKTTCSAGALARLLNITTRRVHIMVQDGIIPKPPKPGQYDLYGCTHGYINFLKQRSAGRHGMKDELAAVELESKKFKLELQKGLYILRDEVGQELVKRIHILKRDFRTIENRLSKYPEAKEIVKRGHLNMMRLYSNKSGVFKAKK